MAIQNYLGFNAFLALRVPATYIFMACIHTPIDMVTYQSFYTFLWLLGMVFYRSISKQDNKDNTITERN